MERLIESQTTWKSTKLLLEPLKNKQFEEHLHYTNLSQTQNSGACKAALFNTKPYSEEHDEAIITTGNRDA